MPFPCPAAAISARVAADQIVEHAALGAEIEKSPGLMNVEMRRSVGDAHAKDAAGFSIGFRRRELEPQTVEFVGHLFG
jgi:hypothetical protein